MAVAAGRIGLHGDFHGLPDFAEAGDRLGRIRVRRVAGEEAGLALEGLGRAAIAFGRQRRGDQAGHGGVADMGAFGPGAVGEELHRAGGLAQADAEGALDLPGVQAHDAGDGSRCAERAAGRRGMEAALVMVARPEGHAEPDLDFVAGDDGGDGPVAARAGLFRRRQRRRHDRRTGMDRAAGVGVVEIQRMGERAVDQRRARRGVAVRVADRRRRVSRHAEAVHRRDQAFGRFRIPPGAQGDAEGVEDQQLGTARDLRRQIAVGEAGGKFRRGAGDGWVR